MKKTILLFFVLITIQNSEAQDHFNSFTGEGEAAEVNTVLITNLMSRLTVTPNGNDILQLIAAVGINASVCDIGMLKIYPNSMTDASVLAFETTEEDNVVNANREITCKAFCQKMDLLSTGKHTYCKSGSGQGMYFLEVTGTNFHYSTKLFEKQCVK
jgi:hypothetical protein